MLHRLERRPIYYLGLVVVIFALGTLAIDLNRYYSFYASYDQGIFNQVFWNSSYGRFFQSSLSSQLSTNVVHGGELPNPAYHRLGQHFTPLLLLWLPIYSLFRSAVALIFIQVGLITAAGLVLYRLARCYLDRPLAAAIAMSYYGANAVLGPTLCNFHDNVQIPLLMFTLLLALEKRWWWLFGLMALLIPWAREDSGVVLFGVGLYLLVRWRYPLVGLGLCVYSLAYCVAVTTYAMPLFSADATQRFAQERFGQYLDGAGGGSSLDILRGMLANPLLLLREIVSPPDRTLLYLLGQWLPLMFVPAIALDSWLIAGCPLFQLLVARGEAEPLSINIRYAMALVPGLFYGAILWWARRPDPLQLWRSRRRFWSGCLMLSVLVMALSNPNRSLSFVIPDSLQPRVYVPLVEQWRHASAIYPLLANIPPRASVSATTFLVPHLSSRRTIVRFPNSMAATTEGLSQPVDYAIADLWQMDRYRAAFKSDGRLLAESLSQIDRVLDPQDDRNYGLVGFDDGVVLLKARSPSDPQARDRFAAFRQQLAAHPIQMAANPVANPASNPASNLERRQRTGSQGDLSPVVWRSLISGILTVTWLAGTAL
jgi:uncharacterized membrane protein